MNNIHFCFLIILIIAGLSCEKEDKSKEMDEDQFTEQQLIGTWEGAINQVGYGDFTGLVTIAKLKLGEVSAMGSYDSPPCSFLWTYSGTSADGRSFLFQESIVQVNSECGPGRVQLKFKDQNHLYYNWTGDDVSGNNVASGILTKK